VRNVDSPSRADTFIAPSGSTVGDPRSRAWATPAPPWSWRRWVTFITLAFVVSFFRPDPSNQRFTMGSEDGAIFTHQVRSLGVLRSFDTPSAGYFHLLPRSVAAAASALPLAWTPSIYFTAAAAAAAVAAAVAGRCARGMELSAPGAAIVAASVLVLPAAGWEVPLLLTNVEWYVIAAFVVFIAAWIGGYEPPMQWTVPLLVVGGLTSPLLAISLPVILPVAYLRRRRLDVAVGVTCVCTTALQLVGWLAKGQISASGHWSVAEIIRVYAVRVVLGGALGARSVPYVWREFGAGGAITVAAVAIGALAAMGLRWGGAPRWVCAYALYASVAYVAVAIVLRPHFFSPTLPIGQVVIDRQVQLWNGRYMAAPATALVVAAVLSGERLLRTSRLARCGVLAAAVLFVCVLAASFPIDLHHDSYAHWENQVHAQQLACNRDHGRGSVVIHYGIPTDAPAWTLRLTCRQAFGGEPTEGSLAAPLS
jgi:hypothetical protein